MSTKKVTTSQQNTAPPAWAAPALNNLAGRVNEAVDRTAGMTYSGDFVAGPNWMQRAGQAAQLATLPTLQDNASAVQGLAEGLSNFQPNTAPVTFDRYNPAAGVSPVGERRQANLSQGFGAGNLQEAINALARDPIRIALEQAMPQLTSAAIANGAWGSEAAKTTLPSMIARDMNESIANIAARMGYQDFSDTRAFNQNEQMFTDQFNEQQRMTDLGFDYGQYADFIQNMFRGRELESNLQTQALNNELARVGTAINARGAANDMALNPGTLLSGLGQERRAWDQSMLDNEIARFQEAYAAPWRGLELGTSLINPLSVPYVSQSGRMEERTSGLGEVVKGVAGLGAMAASAFAPGMGMLGGFTRNAAQQFAPTFNSIRQGLSAPQFQPSFAPMFLPSGRVG